MSRPALLRWPWLLVFIAIAYVTLATTDVRIGPVPVKWLLTMAAITAWWFTSSGHRTLDHGLTFSVIAIGVVIPALWFMIAVLRAKAGDPTQTHGLHDAAEQASRFTYVLLALPVRDWISRKQTLRHAVWLIPVFVLCLITWSLFVAYVCGANYGYSGNVGPLRGSIGETTSGDFRAFIVNDVILIPATLLVISFVRMRGLTVLRAAMLLCIISTAYLAHTRGIWIALCVGAIILLVLTLPALRVRRILIIGVATSLGIGLAISAAPQTARSLVDAVTGGKEELSTSVRLEQGPKLVAAFEDHPVIGSGLGAWLPSGYRRSIETPWSFELSYLQLLFQLGLVGLAFLVGAIGPVLLAARRHLRKPDCEGRIGIVAGISSLGGYLFAVAGNPYLMTSVGMFALGVSLAYCTAGTEWTVGSTRDAESEE